jgi:hypothetical protein
VFTYWSDESATVPLAGPQAVETGGTYYIKGTAGDTECYDIQPVNVTVNASPNLVVNQPAPACEPATVDLTDPAITAGSDPQLDYSYWEDAAAAVSLSNPEAVTTGTYYIKATDPETGCFAVQEVNVTVNPAPVVAITNPAPLLIPKRLI